MKRKSTALRIRSNRGSKEPLRALQMLDKDQVEASSRLSREEALEFLESYQKLVAGLSKEGLPQDMVIQLPDK